MPSAVRRAPVSYALETIEEESGCWTPDPSPARSRSPSSEAKLPAHIPAAMKPHAVTAVPAASRRRSPQRSARRPAGIWNEAMAPVYAVRISPTCAKPRRNSLAHSGRRM